MHSPASSTSPRSPTPLSSYLPTPKIQLTSRIGKYRMPFNLAYISSAFGCMLYGLAYKANFLYLILIGRIVSGVGFVAFMYVPPGLSYLRRS